MIETATITKSQQNEISSADKQKPVALILAGYNKVDSETKKREIRELSEAYDGDVIYIGQNKFLYSLAGKPVIQYVIDAVFNAKKKHSNSNEKLYEKIYIYNDIETIERSIDLSQYPNVIIKQMKDSVGGHFKDFCHNNINYGQRVDLFFGDTPRITSSDVEWIHEEYTKILGKEKDHKGNIITLLFGIVDFKDMNDNWLEHRLKYIKVGRNKGKLKNFVGLKNYQARVGNSSSFIYDKSQDDLIEHKAVNFFYNLRKAVNPRVISRIIYHLWKTKHFNMIKQLRNKSIDENDLLDTAFDVLSKVFKIDLSKLGGTFFKIRKNASRWENDIDSPKDLDTLEKKFREFNK